MSNITVGSRVSAKVGPFIGEKVPGKRRPRAALCGIVQETGGSRGTTRIFIYQDIHSTSPSTMHSPPFGMVSFSPIVLYIDFEMSSQANGLFALGKVKFIPLSAISCTVWRMVKALIQWIFAVEMANVLHLLKLQQNLPQLLMRLNLHPQPSHMYLTFTPPCIVHQLVWCPFIWCPFVSRTRLYGRVESLCSSFSTYSCKNYCA